MEQERTLELNLISAKDLKNLNFFSKMDVYAVVSITGDSSNHNQKQVKSPIDREGGTNPVWNFTIKLTFNETLARQNRLILEVHLRCDRALAADKDVGRIDVPLAELLNQSSGNEGKPFHNVTYQVRRPSGRPKGSLNFAYKFGDKVAPAAPVNALPQKAEPVAAYPPPAKDQAAPHKAEPVMAYPPPATGSSSKPYATAYPPPPPEQQQYPAGYGYPPPPPVGYPQGQPAYGYRPQSGYGYPPQQSGYGYPPQHSGYGYPPPQQGGYGYPPPQQGGYGYPPQGQKPGKNKFGMGLGAGLLGGALGGLLIGDMVSDSFGDDYGFDLF